MNAEAPNFSPRPASANGVLGPADQVQRALVAMQQSEVEQQIQSLPRAASLARNN
jgi:hypothetical protein